MTAHSIPLSRGLVASVSPQDFRSVVKRKWCVLVTRDGRCYAQTNLNVGGKWKRVLLHRYIMQPARDVQVDHKDGDGLNNTRENLRLCTQSQNLHNTNGYLSKNKTSIYKGVSWSALMQLWHAQIMVDRDYLSLGYYRHEADAALAYDYASVIKCGEFARPNFPDAEPLLPLATANPRATAIALSASVGSYLAIERAIRQSGFAIGKAIVPATRGPERAGEVWASLHGIPFERHSASNRAHRPGRNRRMIAAAEALVAIWDGGKDDVSHLIVLAQAKGIPTYVVRQS